MANETEDFFRRVLSDKGFPVVTSLKKGHAPHQFSCDTFPNFFERIGDEKQKCNKDFRDLYFCISTLKQRVVHDEKGKPHTRIGSNCLETRSLILDVDVDPTGFLKGDPNRICFISPEEAYEGVKSLCEVLTLPDPYIINSGYGLHVYWPFEQAMGSDKWFEIATKFKLVCNSFDKRLIADASRVTDRASILRVPNTFNFKDVNSAREVNIFKECGMIWPFSFYEQHIMHYVKENNLLEEVFNLANTGGLKQKIVNLDVIYSDQKVDFKHVFQKCNWVGNYMRNQAKASYNEWFAMVNLSSKCQYVVPAGKTFLGKILSIEEETVVSGLDLAKLVSIGHPDYKEEEVQKKYDESMLNSALAARTCDDLQRWNNEPCKTCEYRTIVKTPLSISKVAAPLKEVIVTNPIVVAGVPIAAEQIKLPPPPFPYDIGDDGAIYVRQKDDAGNRITSKVLYEYTVIPLGRVKDDFTGTESVEIEARLPHRDTKRFLIPMGVLYGRDAAKFLADRGILVSAFLMKEFVDYLIAYTKQLQKAEPAVNNYNTFGWKDITTVAPKFVLYDSVINSSGVTAYKNTANSLKEVGRWASASGDIQRWKDCFNIYVDVPDMEAHIVNLMLAFGAPLLHFLNEFGLIYNLYGPGGEGKSSSLLLATSVWGHPTVSHAAKTDSENSLYYKLGILGNIPMAFDEVTNLEAKDISNLAYAMSLGRVKDALDRNRELKHNNMHWQTFMLTNSNFSLYGKLSTLPSGNNAHGYRILEYTAPAPNALIGQRMREVKEVIKENYGLAGRVYMKYILENYSSMAMETRKVWNNLPDKDQSRERFWVAAQVAIQVGGSISRELGLHDYEPGRLLEYMRDSTPRHQVQEITGDSISKLNDYMMQNLNSTIKDMDGSVVNLELEFKGPTSIGMRLEGHKGEVYKAFVPTAAIERWCKQNGTDFTWLRTELQRNKVLTRTVKRRIGAGTKYFSATANCWELDMQHPLVTGHERGALKDVVVKLPFAEKK